MEAAPTSWPKVTIMIPTFRQQDVVGDAIASALAQDYPNLEVVVADDASPDATREAVARFEDPRLRYYRNEKNFGRVGNYRNALYCLATGEWAINLDGDDYYTDPGFISAAVAEAMTDPSIVMVVARRRAQRLGTTITVTAVPPIRSLTGIEMIMQMPALEFHVSHMATLYRRDLAVGMDFYRSDLISSDWESLYRLALHGRVAYLDQVVGDWRIGPGNASQSCGWRARFDNLRIWETIFEAALAAGTPPQQTAAAKAATLTTFSRFALMSVLESEGFSAAWQFIGALRHYDLSIARKMVLNPRVLIGLCRAALGLYPTQAQR